MEVLLAEGKADSFQIIFGKSKKFAI